MLLEVMSEFCFLTTCQSLSQDLLHMVERLGSLEEQVQRSNSGSQTGGVTAQELEERQTLKNQRDSLDSQLEDDKVLSAEARGDKLLCVVVCFTDPGQIFFLTPLFLLFTLRLRAGGAFAASARGSH